MFQIGLIVFTARGNCLFHVCFWKDVSIVVTICVFARFVVGVLLSITQSLMTCEWPLSQLSI